jgi:F420-non-reducing hydrogenase iron-sulfur subunit
MKELIGFVGISPDRLRLEWISSSEGAKFAHLMSEFTQRIRELGPSPLREDGHSFGGITSRVSE